ncbi:prolyl oligopeptidase family serine peptidase [Actinomycetospora soli]|uniref:prolyl oligopeptidase family serine peptidase n=1 Tax=Actinomycetospora soli TaxID=2893887 RepID=UPI001E60C007|nr:prolyl oligopeptidase family serine peptidase [Actinomycetospora soli]MCD2189787.1 prolyl oligopeptidase family serine peptidase [Actinomycetospora soli]
MTSSDARAPETDDPYLWLEDVTGDEALSWVRERNGESLGRLTDTERFTELRDGLRAVLDSDDRIPYTRRRGERLYNFWQDAEHPRGLWRRTTLDDYRTGDPTWELLLDVDALARDEDENWVWAGAAARWPDYTRALVQLSRGGADATVVREFDLEAKRFLTADEGGFTLPEAKSRVSWIDDDTVFVGTDLGPGSMTTSGYPRVMRRWSRGTAVTEAPVVFEAQETDVSAFAGKDRTRGFEREMVGRSPDFHTVEEFVVRDDGSLVLIEAPADADTDIDRAWLLVRTRSPWTVEGTEYGAGTLLAFDAEAFLTGSREHTVLFSPTASRSLSGWSWTKSYLILTVLEDVATRLEVLTPPAGPEQWAAGDWSRRELPTGEAFAEVAVVGTDPDESDEIFLDTDGFTRPSTFARTVLGASAEEDAPLETLRSAPSFWDTTGVTVQQFFATSDDGTRVPYFVVGKESADSGPVLMTGYGGFEISLTPSYSGVMGRGWISQGGTYVVANIRGGGEYGPEWHTSALREHRHRAYEDFAAVARDLVDRGITTPDRLAIHGGSNGGLLMGVMITRYPELFGAVVVMVPLLDMRRFHLLLAGASWQAEYGEPDDPDDWAFISQYSPYQHLSKDATYPSILVTTSTRDDRVHPGHARKFVARLREYGHPVEYYENVEGGHGGAADNAQRAFQWALVLEFCRRVVG